MKNKSFIAGLLSYVLWGVMAVYWKLFSGMDAMFILVNRIVWSCVFTGLYLAVTDRLGEVKKAFKDRRSMLLLAAASLMITLNWGLYIWAINDGRILETSLGYYLNPLVLFVFGALLFHERFSHTEVIAIILAAIGVMLCTLQAGSFPYVAIVLAVSFSLYGSIKKFANVDGIVSIFIETILIMPFALAYRFTLGRSGAIVASVPSALLLISSGIMTSVPLILFTYGVNGLPFITMGFLQYTSPTLLLLTGVFLYGEPFGALQAISFAIIWLGIAVFSYGSVMKHKQSSLAASGPSATPAPASDRVPAPDPPPHNAK